MKNLFNLIHEKWDVTIMYQVTMIIPLVLWNKYTKTQSYMQCGTMSVKNPVGRLGVHDKTDHTLVSQVTFTR